MTVNSFISALFSTIGWIGVVLSGGCSIIVLGNWSASNPYVNLYTILLFGGVPLLICVFFIWLGKKLADKDKSSMGND